jgi:hypothetical protein
VPETVTVVPGAPELGLSDRLKGIVKLAEAVLVLSVAKTWYVPP